MLVLLVLLWGAQVVALSEAQVVPLTAAQVSAALFVVGSDQ